MKACELKSHIDKAGGLLKKGCHLPTMTTRIKVELRGMASTACKKVIFSGKHHKAILTLENNTLEFKGLDKPKKEIEIYSFYDSRKGPASKPIAKLYGG